MRATPADKDLESEPEAAWYEPRLGGALNRAGGRCVLRGAADYTAARRGNRDFSGNARFTVRFR